MRRFNSKQQHRVDEEYNEFRLKKKKMNLKKRRKWAEKKKLFILKVLDITILFFSAHIAGLLNLDCLVRSPAIQNIKFQIDHLTALGFINVTSEG